MKKISCYGYADGFKAIIRSQGEMNKATENIEKWLSENKMTPNTKKFHIVNIKGALKANLMDSPLEPVESQRDLGLILYQNLNWSENV